MNVRFILLLIWGMFLWNGCEQVGELINPKRLPELDERGIVLSQDQVMPRDTIRASIKATNPLEGPLQYDWHADGGSFLPPFDNDTVFWVAPLSGGLYHLWVIVKNEDGESASPRRQINVISTSEPVVNILEPQDGAYFVTGQSCAVTIQAEHENGVSIVRLWINDHLMGESDNAQNGLYLFNITLDETMVGKTALKAEATANNQLQSKGQDVIYIYVGGILAGENEQ